VGSSSAAKQGGSVTDEELDELLRANHTLFERCYGDVYAQRIVTAATDAEKTALRLELAELRKHARALVAARDLDALNDLASAGAELLKALTR
jgi:hypothetical protein